MLTKAIRYAITLNSIKIGSGKSRNLVVHHGLMGSSKNFRSVARSQTVAKYCNSFLIDARNHGDSPHTATHTVSELADDLLEYLRDNQLDSPQKRVTLMGHSMGGLALMEFTKRHFAPAIQDCIDRVIIIDIPTNPVKEYPSYQATGNMLKQLHSIDLKQQLSAIHAEIDKYALNKDIAALLKTNVLKNQSGFSWLVNLKLLAFEGYDNIGRYDLLEGNPKQWRKPVQYIYGQKSNYHSAQHFQRFQQCYPQMTIDNFHGIKNAGHWVHADNPTDFLSALERILGREGAS